MTGDNREEAVRAAIQRWLEATLSADVETLDGLLDPNYFFTHASTAITETREEWLESLRSGRRRFQRWDISDLSVTLYPETAVMTGHGYQEAARPDGIATLRSSFMNVWIERDGQWRLAGWQATRIPDA